MAANDVDELVEEEITIQFPEVMHYIVSEEKILKDHKIVRKKDDHCMIRTTSVMSCLFSLELLTSEIVDKVLKVCGTYVDISNYVNATLEYMINIVFYDCSSEFRNNYVNAVCKSNESKSAICNVSWTLPFHPDGFSDKLGDDLCSNNEYLNEGLKDVLQQRNFKQMNPAQSQEFVERLKRSCSELITDICEKKRAKWQRIE